MFHSDIGLHRSDSHQHIPQRLCFIGRIGLSGQDHTGNLDAVIGLGYLLEEGFAVLRQNLQRSYLQVTRSTVQQMMQQVLLFPRR